jgi:hypothetical protein
MTTPATIPAAGADDAERGSVRRAAQDPPWMVGADLQTERIVRTAGRCPRP